VLYCGVVDNPLVRVGSRRLASEVRAYENYGSSLEGVRVSVLPMRIGGVEVELPPTAFVE